MIGSGACPSAAVSTNAAKVAGFRPGILGVALLALSLPRCSREVPPQPEIATSAAAPSAKPSAAQPTATAVPSASAAPPASKGVTLLSIPVPFGDHVEYVQMHPRQRPHDGRPQPPPEDGGREASGGVDPGRDARHPRQLSLLGGFPHRRHPLGRVRELRHPRGETQRLGRPLPGPRLVARRGGAGADEPFGAALGQLDCGGRRRLLAEVRRGGRGRLRRRDLGRPVPGPAGGDLASGAGGDGLRPPDDDDVGHLPRLLQGPLGFARRFRPPDEPAPPLRGQGPSAAAPGGPLSAAPSLRSSARRRRPDTGSPRRPTRHVAVGTRAPA